MQASAANHPLFTHSQKRDEVMLGSAFFYMHSREPIVEPYAYILPHRNIKVLVVTCYKSGSSPHFHRKFSPITNVCFFFLSCYVPQVGQFQLQLQPMSFETFVTACQ